MTFKRTRPALFYVMVCAAKGRLSASEIGAAWGLSRCAVIGIWDRANLPPLTPEQRHIINSRAQRAAFARRREGLHAA